MKFASWLNLYIRLIWIAKGNIVKPNQTRTWTIKNDIQLYELNFNIIFPLELQKKFRLILK